MASERNQRKGYLQRDSKSKSRFFVGAKDLSDARYPYHGPCAKVSYDKTWLHITTDDYEGHAMLNIEALPYLRRALATIAKQIKTAASTRAAQGPTS